MLLLHTFQPSNKLGDGSRNVHMSKHWEGMFLSRVVMVLSWSDILHLSWCLCHLPISQQDRVQCATSGPSEVASPDLFYGRIGVELVIAASTSLCSCLAPVCSILSREQQLVRLNYSRWEILGQRLNETIFAGCGHSFLKVTDNNLFFPTTPMRVGTGFVRWIFYSGVWGEVQSTPTLLHKLFYSNPYPTTMGSAQFSSTSSSPNLLPTILIQRDANHSFQLMLKCAKNKQTMFISPNYCFIHMQI